ncbi:MAG: BBP7 family outer membrane beta-barrel protein [Pirellulaceae bacterium]|nr:BBP7 family outer membrane beta-barrel protein [Pirellulaceae bacterium]
MKMNFRGMTLAALLLSASQTAYADDSQVEYDGDGTVTPVAFVGDMPSQSEDAYFAADANEASRLQRMRQAKNVSTANHQVVRATSRPAASRPATTVATRTVAPQVAPQTRQVQYAPISAMQLQPAGHQQVQQVGLFGGGYSACDAPGGCDMPGCDSPGCSLFGGGQIGSGFSRGGCSGSSCDGGCDSGNCGSSSCGGLAGLFGLCSRDGWARHEALLWFVQDRKSPSLITTSAPGTLPELPNATTRFGGEINGDMSFGYRGDMGVYLTDNVGVGGRLWWLDDNEDSLSLSGNGSDQSIGRPFFDTTTNDENSLLVALQNNFAGSVSAISKLEMMAAEGYARINLGCTKSCQLDLIGGYSYFSVDDSLRITSTSIQNSNGRTRTYSDLFDTENTMHGGQIGFEAVVSNGRWFARSLTKVHLGNMNQMIRIAGTSTDRTVGPGTSANSGFLALGNQGTWERDEFTFVPEMNFKLGYRFRKHVEMSVGYTFLMFDSLALAGDQIDRNIDPSSLNTSGPHGTRPAFDFNDSSLWLQGLDLGMAITF